MRLGGDDSHLGGKQTTGRQPVLSIALHELTLTGRYEPAMDIDRKSIDLEVTLYLVLCFKVF